MSQSGTFSEILGQFNSDKYKEEIRRKARYDGGRQRPTPGQTELSEAEQGIYNDCLRVLRDQRALAEARILDKRRALLEPHGEESVKTSRLLAQVENDLFAQRKMEANHFEELIKARNSARMDLRDFRSEHGITRRAHYPENRFWLVAGLTVMLVLESVLNANMLAKTNIYGIVGGWAEAIFISLANILVGFFVGLVPTRFSFFGEPDNKYRKRARTGLGGCIVFIILFNFVFAHYRLSASPEVTDIMHKTLEGILAQPLSIFLDIKSFALFIVGLMFSGIAAFEGFQWDDKYPMYGKIYRKWENAKDDILAAKDAMRDTVRKTIRSTIDDLSSLQTASEKTQHLIETLEASCRSEVQRYQSLTESVAAMLQQLVTLYRNTNRDVRNSAVPAYFANTPVLPEADDHLDCDLDEIRIDVEAKAVAKARLDGVVDEVIDELLAREQAVLEELEEFFNELEERCRNCDDLNLDEFPETDDGADSFDEFAGEGV